MEKPIVSILTTCFNRDDFVSLTIESVLSQSFGDFEYIIVDDGSTDRSFEIIREYAKNDSRIRIFQNQTNLGDYPNRNKAASYAVGKYLKYVDSDDILLEHAIEVMIGSMKKFPEAGIGLSTGHSPKGPYPRRLSPREAFLFNIEETDLFGRSPGSTILLKQAFEKAGAFSGKRQIGDLECWTRMACMFDVVLLPRDLIWCRLHPNQEQNYDSEDEKHSMVNQVWQATAARSDFPLTDREFEKFMRGRTLRHKYHKFKRGAFSIIGPTLFKKISRNKSYSSK